MNNLENHFDINKEFERLDNQLLQLEGMLRDAKRTIIGLLTVAGGEVVIPQNVLTAIGENDVIYIQDGVLDNSIKLSLNEF